MKNLFSPNKTSARLLVEYAAQAWQNSMDEAQRLRYLMVYDLFIKARSYAILNKIFFLTALAAGLAVLVWPSIAVIARDLGWQQGFWESAVVQTSVTGLAALLFAAYSHYKKRQTQAENLMRHVVFSGESASQVVEKILREMERMDQGFVFSESVLPKAKTTDEAEK